jgi:hypothetical protein
MAIASSSSQAVRQSAPWIERLARLGYAAKGVVYTLVGLLALQTALGRGGELTDSGGAFRTILQQPFGRILLAIIALGLVGYAAWRFAGAFLDAEGKGSDASGLGIRTGYFIRASAHLVLAIQALRMAMSGASSLRGNEAASVSSSVMDKPFGVFLLVAIGLGIGIHGLWQIIRAWRSELGWQLRLTMAASAKRWIVAICRAGLAARGVVFALIGFFVVQAALHHDASEARGMSGTLRAIESGDTGKWMLPLMAVGLIAYGVYEFIKARYRVIRT